MWGQPYAHPLTIGTSCRTALVEENTTITYAVDHDLDVLGAADPPGGFTYCHCPNGQHLYEAIANGCIPVSPSVVGVGGRANDGGVAADLWRC